MNDRELRQWLQANLDLANDPGVIHSRMRLADERKRRRARLLDRVLLGSLVVWMVLSVVGFIVGMAWAVLG